MAKPEQWKKLAVGLREVNPADLLANPKNWRIHGAAQREALRGSIHELGYGDPVELLDGTDLVLDGHLRVDLAIQEQQDTITVVDLRFETDAEADQYLLTKDPISAMANADREKLESLMAGVSTGEAAVQAMIAEMAEREGIVDAFLDDARESGDGSSPWPDDEGEDQNRLVLPVTPGQRDAIMSAVKRTKAADVSLRTTTEALVVICEAA